MGCAPLLIDENSQVLVELKDINMLYSGSKNPTEALANVNLTINKGEFVCALGPSGCGKSTLLNIIAGLIVPTSGIITMLGEPIMGIDRNRAVMFQTPTLYPWLNTFDNVAFGPKMRGLPKSEINELTEKYLDLVGLSEFAQSKPYELSGGMKQRAALARVLVNQPEMILMDEPLGALDALTRSNMQSLIRDMWKETNSTIFFITHDVDEALSLATKIIVMTSRPGQIALERKVGFTHHMDDKLEEDVRYSHEYIALRKEILTRINS